MTPTIEKDDLQEAILWWIAPSVSFSCFLRPFHSAGSTYWCSTAPCGPCVALLRWLDGYRVGGKNAPLANDTKIAEFRRLNEAAIRKCRAGRSAVRPPEAVHRQCVARNADAAGGLPQPAGDVGDGSALSEEQLGEIMKVQRTLDYLVRLNRSLLLLSKIENGQFPKRAGRFLMRWSGVRPKICRDLRRAGMRLLREEGRLAARMTCRWGPVWSRTC